MPSIDEQSAAAVASRAADVLRPFGALARLDEVAVWAAAWNGVYRIADGGASRAGDLIHPTSV
ncbi:MAG TPA: hypothetical protein PLV68_20410, partial [Ilumatobacteraceae bacterium]|nr:hypothetical protein [Ilumatobacteraceae bacterium]